MATGFRHGPASLTTTAAQTSGVVQLIAPMLVKTSLPSFPRVAVFTTLNIHFVPEPKAATLLATGLVGLVIFVAARRKR